MTEYLTPEQADLIRQKLASEDPLDVIIGTMRAAESGVEMTDEQRDTFPVACEVLALHVLDVNGFDCGVPLKITNGGWTCDAQPHGDMAVELDFQFDDGSGIQLVVIK